VNPKSLENLKRGSAANPVADAPLTENSPPCCLECHFAFEEEHVLPHLPQRTQTAIKRDHAKLRRALSRGRLDRAMITAHSEAEETLFAEYVPLELRARMTAEHRKIACVLQVVFGH
jgi:hypothetical protein